MHGDLRMAFHLLDQSPEEFLRVAPYQVGRLVDWWIGRLVNRFLHHLSPIYQFTSFPIYQTTSFPIYQCTNVPQVTAQPLRPLDQMHREALVGQRQRRRHPRHTTADDQHRLLHRHLSLVQRLQSQCLRHRHPHQVFGLLRRRFPVVGMDPRALIANVGHLEHTRVQPRLADTVLKQRLVGQRRTGGDHDPVEPQFPRLLRDVLDRILRTGVQVVLGVHYPRQARRVLRHRRHVEEAADVGPAMADENADARFLRAHVPLRRIRHLPRASPASRGHDRPSSRRRAAGLDHRFGDVLRFAERPHGEDSRTARLQRLEGKRATEPVLVQFHAQPPPQFAHSLRNLHPHGEHHQVKLFLDNRRIAGSKWRITLFPIADSLTR